MSNSKQRFNNNYRLGNAAITGDYNPKFLREFADWVEKWLQFESSKPGISSLIKEGVDFWEEDVRPSQDQSGAITWLNTKLDEISDDIDSCMLDADAVQVSAAIAGYAARKVIVERSKCIECRKMALASSEKNSPEEDFSSLRQICDTILRNRLQSWT